MTAFENNWRNKTLENLEKLKWDNSESDSRLIKRTKELRKIPLNTFTTEDLRIMIGQQIGLAYLIPLALDFLKKNLFAEGDLFEGDLLKNVFAIRTEYWDNHKESWLTLNELTKNRCNEIAEKKFDLSKFDSSKHRQ